MPAALNARKPADMLNLTAPQSDLAALAEPHADTAIRTLVDALGHDDGPTRVAAAVTLLALAHRAPVTLLAVDSGVTVEVSALGEARG